ncbi:MAG TPA: NAD(P)H-dependent oxidoreductase [Halococcus sp.]|nr:NAD(P)H-dependent oxidoreductase [Halococcus sp.]
MPERPHVVALSGSLRDESYTRLALEHALAEAEAMGASTDLIDLRELNLPIFNADARDAGDALALKDRIRRGDSVLLGTPSYHGSYSSGLKTALDYCGFDEFENTTVGLLCVGLGAFPITPLDHLRSVARALHAWIIPHQAAVPQVNDKFENGELVDENSRERVATLGRRAVEYAYIEPDPPSIESTENAGADD